MALSQDRIRAAYERPNAAVTNLVRAFTNDNLAWSPDLDSSAKLDAYGAVFRYVWSMSRGSLEEAAADTGRLWDRMSGETRRRIALAPQAADSLIAPLALADAMVSAKLPSAILRASTDIRDVGPLDLDAMGRDRWARLTGASGIGASAGSSAYGALASSYDASKGIASLNASNFSQSPFAGTGLDLQTVLRLGAMGFNQQNILAGVAHARLFGSGPQDERAVRDFADIDRHDPRSREFVARLQDYQRRLREDEDLKKLQDERRNTQDRERQRELDREIARRREVHARDAGLPQHIDRTENPNAQDAQRRRKEGVEKQWDVNRAVNQQHGVDAARAITDVEVSDANASAAVSDKRRAMDKAAAAPAATLAAKF